MSVQPSVIGQILLQRRAASEADLEDALDIQRTTGERLGAVLVRRGVCDEATVAEALAAQLNLPYAPAPLEPRPEAARLVRPELARSRGILPLSLETRSLQLAMADPLDLATVDDVRFLTGRRIETAVATPTAVAEGQDRIWGGALSALVRALPGDGGDAGPAPGEEDVVQASSGPVARLVDGILERAVSDGASDVHIERYGDSVRVRNRVDGVLREVVGLPPGSRGAVLSRIKILGGMDISVKRRPQDGGFAFRPGGRRLNVRVSTIPVDGGEKAVLRILDPDSAPSDLSQVGLPAEDLARLRRLLAGGQGVILAAGPTGSGKSTTLFGALGEVDRDRLNVVTLEDPIEYRLPGINQVQVRPRAGLTFPAALRSVLRQDPDVIMIGEIRDPETAEIAMAAAVTGHLVLSTVHTVDAPGALARLLNMGVPPYLLAGGLSAVVAQRLVRRVCPACRGRRKGCDECPDGYRGRIGVFQVLVMTDPIREEVVRGARGGEVRRLALAAGMGSMAADARRKVAEGITTPHEVGRVLQADGGSGAPCPGCGNALPAGRRGCPHCGRPTGLYCVCGDEVSQGWRFCASCLRPLRR